MFKNFEHQKKNKCPKFIFSPLITSEAKGNNKFCKGRQFNCKTGYFPYIIFGIFLLEIKILLYKFFFLCKFYVHVYKFCKEESISNLQILPKIKFIQKYNMVNSEFTEPQTNDRNIRSSYQLPASRKATA